LVFGALAIGAASSCRAEQDLSNHYFWPSGRLSFLISRSRLLSGWQLSVFNFRFARDSAGTQTG
jgi:hypothetical protein